MRAASVFDEMSLRPLSRNLLGEQGCAPHVITCARCRWGGMSSHRCLQPAPSASLRPLSRNLLCEQGCAPHVITCARCRWAA